MFWSLFFDRHVDSLMSKQNVKNTNIVTYNLHVLFSL